MLFGWFKKKKKEKTQDDVLERAMRTTVVNRSRGTIDPAELAAATEKIKAIINAEMEERRVMLEKLKKSTVVFEKYIKTVEEAPKVASVPHQGLCEKVTDEGQITTSQRRQRRVGFCGLSQER